MPVTRNVQTSGISGNVTATSGQMRLEEHIDWGDVPTRLQEIFTPTTGNAITATEIDPFFGLWRAQSVDFSPRTKRMDDTVAGGASDEVTLPVFEKAVFKITYSSIEQESPTSQDEADQDGEGDPVPFLSHSWSIGGDFITMDNSEMFWSEGSSARATGIAANKVIPTIEHSINWKRVLNPPFEQIRRCLGKVNSKTMRFSTGKIWPETLLFNGAELSRDIMSDGARAWDVTYRFSERRVDAVRSGNEITVSGIGTIEVYDGVGPNSAITKADNDYQNFIDNGHDLGGIYGGWNHFYKKDPPSGQFRLHQSEPATNKHLYSEDEAIYKKYDLLKLFEQDG